MLIAPRDEISRAYSQSRPLLCLSSIGGGNVKAPPVALEA